MVPEVLVDVERIEERGIEAGEEHVDDDGDVDLFLALALQIAVGEPLILDALLDILVVEVELVDFVASAVPPVVVRDDSPERRFFALGVLPVVRLLPGEDPPGSAGRPCCPPRAAKRRRRS